MRRFTEVHSSSVGSDTNRAINAVCGVIKGRAGRSQSPGLISGLAGRALCQGHEDGQCHRSRAPRGNTEHPRAGQAETTASTQIYCCREKADPLSFTLPFGREGIFSVNSPSIWIDGAALEWLQWIPCCYQFCSTDVSERQEK